MAIPGPFRRGFVREKASTLEISRLKATRDCGVDSFDRLVRLPQMAGLWRLELVSRRVVFQDSESDGFFSSFLPNTTQSPFLPKLETLVVECYSVCDNALTIVLHGLQRRFEASGLLRHVTLRYQQPSGDRAQYMRFHFHLNISPPPLLAEGFQRLRRQGMQIGWHVVPRVT